MAKLQTLEQIACALAQEGFSVLVPSLGLTGPGTCNHCGVHQEGRGVLLSFRAAAYGLSTTICVDRPACRKRHDEKAKKRGGELGKVFVPVGK